MLSQAKNALTKTCYTVKHIPNSSQIQPSQIFQKRFKETSTKKRCPGDKPKRTRKLLTAATVGVIGTTAAVIAAKNDEDFREWAKEHLPVLDNMVKVVYREEETYLEFAGRSYKELTQWIRQALHDSFKGSMKESDRKKVGGTGVKEACEESLEPYTPPTSAFIVGEEEKRGVADDSSTSKSSVRVPRHIKELKDVEDRLNHTAQDVIQACHLAICSLKEQAYYIDNLDQLIGKHDCKLWEKLQIKIQDYHKSIDVIETGLVSLESIGEKLQFRLENESNLTEDMQVKARNNFNVLMNDVKKAKENLVKEKAKNLLAKRSWDKVKLARMYFSEELETLFPNVWLNDEKIELPIDSLGPFIQHVLESIVYLDKELAKLQTVQDALTSSGTERHKLTGDAEGLITAAMYMETEKFKRTQQAEMQKTLLTHQARCDKQARAAMKQQAEVYKDLKAEALALAEREVERKMALRMEERLAEIRDAHTLEVAKLVGRIQGANQAIANRGDMDKGQQERQQFWSAAQSFLAAVCRIGPSAKQKEPKPLRNEINNVSKSAPEKDELVKVLLESIPQQALEHGVESEEQLKERFLTLEREARKVAAVPEGEVTLLQLLLARLQAALYVNEGIPTHELNNEPFEPELLNNYEILNRARYYVDKNELGQAVRYLNLLRGPSVFVASDWVRDVLVRLETEQAAQALLAHASALDL